MLQSEEKFGPWEARKILTAISWRCEVAEGFEACPEVLNSSSSSWF
jgi:hypothetical protein